MEPQPELEPKRDWMSWMPWRVRVAVGGALGILVGLALVSYFRGVRPSYSSVVIGLVTSVLAGVFAESDVHRVAPPWTVRSRLKGLFQQSEEPDLVAITGVLSASGESLLFERYRRLVDRFMRGMITEREFYFAMRTLAT